MTRPPGRPPRTGGSPNDPAHDHHREDPGEGVRPGRGGPGDLIMADVDLAMGNDVTAPVAIARFRELGNRDVWDPSKVALVPSHFVPAKDIASAKLGMTMREFARQQGIEHFFELGRGGIEHILLPEQALALPGMVIIGADSHSCTYGSSRGVQHRRRVDRPRRGARHRPYLAARSGERAIRLRGRSRAVGRREGHHPSA